MDNRVYGPIDAANNPFQGNARIVDLRGHRRQVSVSDSASPVRIGSLILGNFQHCIAKRRACGKLGFIKAR
jgi:hypothetical protein